MKELLEFKHFVGCDVSNETLDFIIYERGKVYRSFEHVRFPNTLDGFRAMHKWFKSLKDVPLARLLRFQLGGIWAHRNFSSCACAVKTRIGHGRARN